MVPPVIHDERIVDEHPVTVVTAEFQRPDTIFPRYVDSAPPGRKAIRRKSRGGSAFVPAEIQAAVGPDQQRFSGKFFSREIFATQALFGAARSREELSAGNQVPFILQDFQSVRTDTSGHAFQHGDGGKRMHEPAAAARRHVAAVGAQHQNPFAPQRQNIPLVTQQYGTAACHIKGHTVRKGISFGNGAIQLRPVEKAECHERLQNMADLGVDGSLSHQPVGNGPGKIFEIHKLPVGHFEVETSVRRPDRRIDGTPIRHQDAVESPLIAQYVDIQMAVLGGMDAVERIVAVHYRSGAAFPHGFAECGKINLL